VKTIGWKISENLLGYRVKQVSRHRQRTACISSVAKDDAKEKSARTNELDGLERSVVGLKNRRRIFANYFHCRESGITTKQKNSPTKHETFRDQVDRRSAKGRSVRELIASSRDSHHHGFSLTLD